MKKYFGLLILLVALGCDGRGGSKPGPVGPTPVPDGPSDAPSLPVAPGSSLTPRRPTRAEVLDYRGWLTGLRDADGLVIWTPALPGARPEKRTDWLARLSAAGATHVPIGPFDGGPVYSGWPWSNPDWTRDPGAIRALAMEILGTPTRHGHGMVPVIFLDSGAARPAGRLSIVMPTLSQALDDIGAATITVPCGWEPYDWTTEECLDALDRWRPQSQGSVLAWHSPQAWPTMPGVAIDAWWSRWEMALYQTQLVDDRTVDCAIGSPGCWATSARAAVAGIGAGLCITDVATGGGESCATARSRFVLFESTAYHEFRGGPILGPAVSRRVRDWCATYGVQCGFGQAIVSGN